MSYETIIVKKENGIATIILSRPEKLNALNYQLTSELALAIDDVSNDNQIRVLIITGAGRAFCSGGDFRFRDVRDGKFADVAAEAEDMGPEKEAVKRGQLLPDILTKIILALQRMGKPTIAMVNGYAIGTGLDIALACDIRVGSYNASFMVGQMRAGLVPDSGSTWLLPRITSIAKSLELILTTDFCSAEEAYRIGLLNKLVPEQDLQKETMALATRLAEGPPIAQRLAKALVYKGLEMDLETALQFALACTSITLETQDHAEGIQAIAERRKPSFKGC